MLITAVLVPVLAGLALISLRGGASSASTVAPSARPAASAFAGAYVAFLNGRLPASALPDATPGVRALAASGGRVPSADQGGVILHTVQFSGVAGATRATALVIARAGSRILEAALALGYVHSRWQVENLVPPDLSTIFAPPPPPVVVAPADRAAAQAFALAYADYRTGARRHAPAGLATIEHQIARRQDPLAGTPRTRAAAHLIRLDVLPQGQTTAAAATLAAGGHRLGFTFLLRRVGGSWAAWSFPVSEP